MNEVARRCSICGISFPDTWQFSKCPVHDTPTDRIQVDVDLDWAERVKRVQSDMKMNEWAEGVDEGILPVEGKVRLYGGEYFIRSHDVINSGVNRRLQPGDLIRVGQQVFEIQSYREASREYWVRPFSLTLSDEDLEALLSG